MLTARAGAPTQQLAATYREAAFLRTYGNVSDAAKHLFKNRLMARVTPTFYFFRNGARPLLVAGCRVESAAQSLVPAQDFPPALFLHCCGTGALSAARPWWAEAYYGSRLYVWGMAQSQAKY